MEIDFTAPENMGGSWLAPQKRETAKNPPKDQPVETPEVEKAFDESKHPRDPGGEDGGQFVSGGGSGGGLPKVGDEFVHPTSGVRYRVDTIMQPNDLNPTGHVGFKAVREGKLWGPSRGRSGEKFNALFGVSDTSAKTPGSVQSTGQPKFVKSKHKHNESGYTVNHKGRDYEVFRDPVEGSWHALALIGKNNPGTPGVPADNIGFNKGDVVNEIMSGRLAHRIDRVMEADAAEKVITDAGARFSGHKITDAGLMSRITDPETGEFTQVPMKDVTPDLVTETLRAIRAKTKKSEQEDLVKAAATAAVEALAPTLAILAKGQADIVEGLNAETEQIPVRDPETQRIKSVIKRRVDKAGVQIIPETKLPKGTGPTVTS